MSWRFLTAFLGLVLSTPNVWALDDEQIIEALLNTGMVNSGAQVHVRGGQGRVDVDPLHKRSYFILTPDPKDPLSPTLVLPLSTVRYSVQRYSTPAWRERHQAEIDDKRSRREPVPEEPQADVEAYLNANGLSTNPDVWILSRNEVRKRPLQDFLLETYLAEADGKVRLYRGSTRSTELADWETHKVPWASQYYTPSATYGWRYARKSDGPAFVDALSSGTPPLFWFELASAQFSSLVRSGDFTLGVEFPKSAHEAFDSRGQFRDPLYGGFHYLGDPAFGVELEIVSTRAGRYRLLDAYQGPVTAEQLGELTVAQVEGATERLVRQFPEDASTRSLLDAMRGQRSSYALPSDLRHCVRSLKRLH